MQYEQGRGPCLDAATSGTVIVVGGMATERRWPDWAASARATGAASSRSVPLPIQEAVVGALNVYGNSPRAFTEVIRLAQTFAGHAAVAVTNAHRYDSTAALAEQMRTALTPAPGTLAPTRRALTMSRCRRSRRRRSPCP